MDASLRGVTVLVTGATGGIGGELVGRLLACGARVVAHGRDAARMRDLGAAAAVVGDFASLADVARVAREVRAVDVLVNNAGVGFGADRARRETSRDGFELRFAVNYLAPFLLSELLASRAIVNVASAGQAPLDEADLMSERGYDGVLAYRRSKFALVMDTFERARRDPSRRCVALHPGTFLATRMVIDAGIAPQGTAAEGAAAVLAAVERVLAGETGLYLDREREARADPAAYDASAQARLRERALALTAPFRR
ncbi:MAG TPA: SDR family NAD(P)-dependent oxidoreductase [Minicystis sp.]|nr:SDR family NAD(P)-dependent oxidoreductase [Minicystis sp.]